MSKSLKIRTLKRSKFPYGKFSWIIVIKQASKNIRYALPNAELIRPIIELLQNSSSSGFWKLEFENKRDHKKIFTKILLTNPMDVALIKLCHAELIGRIYKIVLQDS